MEIQEYIGFLKDLYTVFIDYIESDIEVIDDYQILINFLETQKIGENKDELKEFLMLLLIISRTHHRSPHFYDKIDKILEFFHTEISQTFSNSELFNLFEKNQRILLYLFKNKFITIDDSIISLMCIKIESNDINFCHFFYPEITSIIGEENAKSIEEEMLDMDPNIFIEFEEKRQLGENDSYISELIRNDSVEEFISYATLKNLKLTSKIKRSIFETNSFLLKKNPTLIEYSAFYGSIQIFQYLKLNNVKLTSSLWLYAIHGRNADMIHLLEENHIQPEDKTFEKCLKESIKFHHNEIALYIRNNLIDDKNINYNIDNKFNENIISYGFHYYNYEFFPNDLNHKFSFFYLCQYNYISLVELLVQPEGFDINKKIILIIKPFFFLIKLSFYSYRIQKKIVLNGVSNYEIFSNNIQCNFFFNEISKRILIKFIIIYLFICKTALYFAAKENNTDVLNFLLSYPRIRLGPNSFKECEKLAEIKIPSFITKIEESLFEGCTKLSHVELPSSIKSIGQYSFYLCESLAKLTIPEKVTRIEKYAFYGCLSLTQMTIPPSVEEIGSYAFRGCSSLSQIDLPSSVKKIGDHAFYKCSSLTQIFIPSKVESIENGAFGKCLSLSNISMPSSVTSIGEYAFDGCDALSQISMPSSLKSIGSYAFNECSSLSQIEIPSSVNSIGNYSFNGCSSLIQVSVPISVKFIGTGAFEECTSMKQIEFPKSLNLDSIGIEATVKVKRI